MKGGLIWYIALIFLSFFYYSFGKEQTINLIVTFVMG